MRILFCSDTYPPQVNGVSVVTALTVEGLRERGWDCAVVAPRSPARDVSVFTANAADVDLTLLPSLPMPTYPDVRVAAPRTRVVRDIVDRFHPDIIHSTTEFIVGRLGARIARARGLPLCTSYHTDFAKYTASYRLPFLRGAVSRSIAKFHAQAARIYTPSAPARRTLEDSGVTREIEVWGRGVDDKQFHPSHRSRDLRHRLGVSDAFTFLHVGRLAPEKGVQQLLTAFARLAAAMPAGSVRLVVAGDGPSLPALRASAHPAVRFLGNLERRTELPALYASADAFVYASLTETLGLVVLEAMASGLPVIATPAGGVADHLRHEENGLAYPGADPEACAGAMRRIMRDHELRARLAEGARLTAEARSWSNELDRLDASYREVLSRRRAA
jgi:phosphatidylinositol alpha 1,6-mannosyltransferase